MALRKKNITKSLKQEVIKPYCSGTKTEAELLSFIRSALRSKWLRWKPRGDCIAENSRPYVYVEGGNKRQKKEVLCNLCNNWFPVSKIEVDHYPVEAGSIRGFDDIGPFCKRLFAETKNLRTVCKSCHSVHTYASKNKISFEDARRQKLIIALNNKSITQLKKDYEIPLTIKKKSDIVAYIKEKYLHD